MLIEDLQTLIDRLDRIERAVDLACVSLGQRYSPEIAEALLDTCDQALGIGYEVTMRVWYDEPWAELDTLHQVWVSIHGVIGRVSTSGVDTGDAHLVVGGVRHGMATLCIATAALDTAQLRVAATPRDPSAVGAASEAIAAFEAAADTLFMTAVTATDDRSTTIRRLDAAYAILTSTAARAARERASVQARQS